ELEDSVAIERPLLDMGLGGHGTLLVSGSEWPQTLPPRPACALVNTPPTAVCAVISGASRRFSPSERGAAREEAASGGDGGAEEADDVVVHHVRRHPHGVDDGGGGRRPVADDAHAVDAEEHGAPVGVRIELRVER